MIAADVDLAGVLWDMDGTLLDAERAWYRAHRRTARACGGDLTDAELTALTGVSLDASVAAILRATGRPAGQAEVIRTWLLGAVEDEYLKGVPWMPGACEALWAVRDAGIPVALVTSTSRVLVDLVAHQLGAFDAMVCGDDVAAPKPDPEPYLTAAGRLDVDPAECIAVEDSPDGAASAEAAGVGLVVVVPGDLPVPDGPRRLFLPTLAGFDPAQLVPSRDGAPQCRRTSAAPVHRGAPTA